MCNEVNYPGLYLTHLSNYQMIAANVLACNFCQCGKSFIQSLLQPTTHCSLRAYRKSNKQTWRSNRLCAHNQIRRIMGCHKLGRVENGLLNSWMASLHWVWAHDGPCRKLETFTGYRHDVRWNFPFDLLRQGFQLKHTHLFSSHKSADI